VNREPLAALPGRTGQQNASWERTHSLEQYAAVFNVMGFEILEAKSAYRGYSDYLVARKP
jgi:hypothetical protein